MARQREALPRDELEELERVELLRKLLRKEPKEQLGPGLFKEIGPRWPLGLVVFKGHGWARTRAPVAGRAWRKDEGKGAQPHPSSAFLKEH